MKVAVEYDDFSGVNHSLDLLEKIKEHYPNFKVTLFTVPWEIRFSQSIQHSSPITLEKFEKWCDVVGNTDWMEIALHGLTHAPMEFAELSYEAAVKRIVIGMKMFENRKFKNFTKIFKAPQWAISPEAKQAVKDMGFVVLEDQYYNWNLANDKPNADAKEPYIMHGHIQNDCGNGMEESLHRVMSLPPDTEFLFLSEIFDTDKGVYNYYGNETRD